MAQTGCSAAAAMTPIDSSRATAKIFIFDDGANRAGVTRENEVVLPEGVRRQDLQFEWQEALIEGRYDETANVAMSIFTVLDVSWGSVRFGTHRHSPRPTKRGVMVSSCFGLPTGVR